MTSDQTQTTGVSMDGDGVRSVEKERTSEGSIEDDPTSEGSVDGDATDDRSGVGPLDEGQSIDYEKAQQGVRLLLEAIGQDPDEGALQETWQRRVPDAMATLSAGYREEAKPTMRTFEADNGDLVVKTGIPVHSLCEHHLLPYTGVAHVAYRPDDEVVGLSKLTRYVRWQSRRLTVQEQLTNDVAEGLADEIGAQVVLVDVTATHFCETMRGIETHTETRTTATVGNPTDEERKRFRTAIDRAQDRQ